MGGNSITLLDLWGAVFIRLQTTTFEGLDYTLLLVAYIILWFALGLNWSLKTRRTMCITERNTPDWAKMVRKVYEVLCYHRQTGGQYSGVEGEARQQCSIFGRKAVGKW